MISGIHTTHKEKVPSPGKEDSYKTRSSYPRIWGRDSVGYRWLLTSSRICSISGRRWWWGRNCRGFWIPSACVADCYNPMRRKMSLFDHHESSAAGIFLDRLFMSGFIPSSMVSQLLKHWMMAERATINEYVGRDLIATWQVKASRARNRKAPSNVWFVDLKNLISSFYIVLRSNIYRHLLFKGHEGKGVKLIIFK